MITFRYYKIYYKFSCILILFQSNLIKFRILLYNINIIELYNINNFCLHTQKIHRGCIENERP